MLGGHFFTSSRVGIFIFALRSTGPGLGCHFAEHAFVSSLRTPLVSPFLAPPQQCAAAAPNITYINVLAIVVPELKFRNARRHRLRKPSGRPALRLPTRCCVCGRCWRFLERKMIWGDQIHAANSFLIRKTVPTPVLRSLAIRRTPRLAAKALLMATSTRRRANNRAFPPSSASRPNSTA